MPGSNALVVCGLLTLRETPRAYLVARDEDSEEVWIGKSQVHEREDTPAWDIHAYTIPRWLAEQHEFDWQPVEEDD